MPLKLFNRDIIVNVGGLRIASRLLDRTRQELGLDEGELSSILKMTFNVTKTLKKEPNTCELKVFNLTKANRIKLQQRKQETTIEAGYVENISQIFAGQLEYASSVHDGTDWVTTLEAGDGSKKLKSARINTSLKGPVKIGDVLKTLARATGLKPGNLEQAASNGSQRGNVSEFINGIVLSGKAEQQLEKLAKTMGLSFSVQDGQLTFLTLKQFLGTQATVLAPGTGLIGSPEPGDDGFVNVRALLQPLLQPGHRVKIESREVNGFYRIDKVTFSGDTWGDDWFADLECRPL